MTQRKKLLLYLPFFRFWQTSAFKLFRKYVSNVLELVISSESNEEGAKLKGQGCQSQNIVETKFDLKMHLENSPRIEVQVIFKPLVLYSFWK